MYIHYICILYIYYTIYLYILYIYLSILMYKYIFIYYKFIYYIYSALGLVSLEKAKQWSNTSPGITESQNISHEKLERSAEEEGLYLTQSFQPPNEADPYFTNGETEA